MAESGHVIPCHFGARERGRRRQRTSWKIRVAPGDFHTHGERNTNVELIAASRSRTNPRTARICSFLFQLTLILLTARESVGTVDRGHRTSRKEVTSRYRFASEEKYKFSPQSR